MKRHSGPEWSQHDQAILFTVHLLAGFRDGQQAPQHPVWPPFPPSLGHCSPAIADSEWGLASEEFILYDHVAPGDGTYVRDQGFFFATGGVGLAATAAVAATRAGANRRRRREAALAVQPRWCQIDQGQLWVSTHGFYLQTMSVLAPWHWSSVVSMEVVSPGNVMFQGSGTAGQVSYIIRSLWAELIFAFWAIQIHPRHPQFSSGQWLPDGWVQRCQDSSRQLPQSRQGLGLPNSGGSPGS